MKKSLLLVLLFFNLVSFSQIRKSAAEEVTIRLDTIENYLKGKSGMNVKLSNSIACLTGIIPKKSDGTYLGWIYYPTMEEVKLWRKWLKVNKDKLFYGVLSDNTIGYDEVIVKFEDGTTRSSYCK
ncbi:hypothetical protein [Flavobacterium sp. RSSB_23]|uniref:hypothetical protein n=1 Tax=Flavobacterium sp. RSSB_23 TaxID=3447668 RepID=UPI003F2D86FF